MRNHSMLTIYHIGSVEKLSMYRLRTIFLHVCYVYICSQCEMSRVHAQIQFCDFSDTEAHKVDHLRGCFLYFVVNLIYFPVLFGY